MMGFERVVSLALICVLSSRLRYCAVLQDADRFDPTDFPDGSYWGRLLPGRVGEKSDSKVRPGKFMIDFDGMKLDAGSVPEPGYQADEAGPPTQRWTPVEGAAAAAVSQEVHNLLGTSPKVECTDDAVSLKLHGVPASYESGMFIDQDAGPPLSLSEVPSGCGVQVHRRWWGLILTVPFVGCFGAQTSDLYTLPVHLSGLPAKLSCPLSLESKPFSVVCNSSGMTVKTPKSTLVDHLWVNVKNEWLPVLKAAVRCNFSIMSESDGLVLSSPYEPCMESKDGPYSLHIAAEKEIQLVCPAAQPTSPSPSPTVGIAIGSEPGPVDAGTSNPSSSPPFEGAQPTMLPTTSLPFGPVTDLPNAGINPSNQPTTKAPLETGPAVESLGLDLASTPLIPTSSPLEHGFASNLPTVPTTSSPAAHPVDWVAASLTPSLAGLPNELPTTSSPVASLPVDNLVNAPLTPSSAGPQATKMPTEPGSTSATSLSQRVYGKPQHPYSSKPWYPVYPQKTMLVPNGGSDPVKPKLPGTSDADSQIPSFPGPVPPYYMNPYMYSNYFNPVPMSGNNYYPSPHWLNQPYFQHGPPQVPISYPVPNFANPNMPPSSLPCKDQSCILENRAPPSKPSKMGGYNPYSSPVGSTTPVGEAKSARPKSTPLKIMKSRLF